MRELISLAAEVEWSLTVNPELQVCAEEEALDLCGSLFIFKHTEAQDNARVESLMMNFLKKHHWSVEQMYVLRTFFYSHNASSDDSSVTFHSGTIGKNCSTFWEIRLFTFLQRFRYN